jgi:formylglycine-generating enzyme required for sulfatase activity
VHSIQLPAVIAHAMGKAPTERALPRLGFARIRGRINRKSVAISSAVLAAVVLAVVVRLPTPLPPPPPGMVRIDVGTIHVSPDESVIDVLCSQAASPCDREQLRRDAGRTVAVKPFFIDGLEVTNEQFAIVLNEAANTFVVSDDTGKHYPRYVTRNPFFAPVVPIIDLHPEHGGIASIKPDGYRVLPDKGKLPVSQVSWHGAALYCESVGKRLPTDSEWEAAASGGDHRRFPWGTDAPRCGQVNVPSGDATTSPCRDANADSRAVGTSIQDVSPEGVHDLAGNVAEWTASSGLPGTQADRAATANSPRIIRGGSWGAALLDYSSGKRTKPPSTMAANIGFRCAMDVDQSK